jgi:hypothetical protein
MPSITGTSAKSNGLTPFRQAALTPYWFGLKAVGQFYPEAHRAAVACRFHFPCSFSCIFKLPSGAEGSATHF